MFCLFNHQSPRSLQDLGYPLLLSIYLWYWQEEGEVEMSSGKGGFGGGNGGFGQGICAALQNKKKPAKSRILDPSGLFKALQKGVRKILLPSYLRLHIVEAQ
jgi:hypothetical protein